MLFAVSNGSKVLIRSLWTRSGTRSFTDHFMGLHSYSSVLLFLITSRPCFSALGFLG